MQVWHRPPAPPPPPPRLPLPRTAWAGLPSPLVKAFGKVSVPTRLMAPT